MSKLFSFKSPPVQDVASASRGRQKEQIGILSIFHYQHNILVGEPHYRYLRCDWMIACQ